MRETRRKEAPAGGGRQRPVLGHDAKGKPVHVGDIVEHVDKPLVGGTVVHKQIVRVSGEPAVYVFYPPPCGLYKNRLSKLVVTGIQKGYRPPSLPEGATSMRALASKMPKMPPGKPPSASAPRKVIIYQGGRVESKR